MSNERMNSTKNFLAMLGALIVAVVLNPIIKLKDWLKGESE